VSNLYEQDELLSQYLLLHYGADEDVLPYPDGPSAALNYPVRCVRELLDPGALPANARALDAGCAVGRSTFELAAHCGEVLGIDTSARFIGAAQALRDRGTLSRSCTVEGELVTVLEFRVPDSLPRSSARFEVGDACALGEHLGTFDVVFSANLIDRLPDPQAYLDALPGLVNPGGQLVITSPFTWLEEFTPREKWIGGTLRDGVPRTTWDALCEILDPHFELRLEADLPFLIREHARKFQWSVARGGRWIRR
jgi:putative 4-mercaptohistidine N1-methyltranferase